MPSIATTSRRVAKHPATHVTAIMVGALAAVAVTIGAIVYFEEKPKAAGPAAPVAPSGQVPVWTQLTPVANPNLPGTFMVQIPAGATFALADSGSDPNLSQITGGLNAAAAAGTISAPQSYSAAPSWWPSDGFGATGYRVSGVASTAFNLSLGALSSTAQSNPPAVWIATAFTPSA